MLGLQRWWRQKARDDSPITERDGKDMKVDRKMIDDHCFTNRFYCC